MSFIKKFFSSVDEVESKILVDDIEKQVKFIELVSKKKGRIFLPNSKYKAGSRQSSSKINQKERVFT